ncbi:MAG: nucleotide sugar dehydrogenase [Candidatus Bathyarchaeia archaeon]
MRKTAAISRYDLVNPRRRRGVTISIMGCNRTGLTTACLLADVGFNVVCIDPDQSIIDRIRKGRLPFADRDLESLLRENIEGGRLSATTEIGDAVLKSNIILLFTSLAIDERGRSDYSNIEKVCRELGLNLRPGALIIVNSNLVPGMTETLIKEILETASGLRAGTEFGLAYCPIRTVPSGGIRDVISNPKVFGAIDNRSSELTRAFLSTITKGEIVELRDAKTAEAVRLFESIYHEANIALANELARFCEEAGIDFMEVLDVANLKPHCDLSTPGAVGEQISDDSYLFIEEAESLKVRPRMIMLARKINDNVMRRVFYLVKDAVRACGRPARRAKVAVLGVSSQPNVKELRGSFVKGLVEFLRGKGLIVKAYDPIFSYRELIEFGFPAEKTLTKAVKGMDCLLIAVGHDRFKRLNLHRIKLLMKKPAAIVDISHIVDPSEVEKRGFVYRGLGRGVWTK